MNYKVELVNPQRMHTAYKGKSRDKAASIADTIRIALVIGNGSGEVILRENDVADVVWSVRSREAFLSLIGGAKAAQQ